MEDSHYLLTTVADDGTRINMTNLYNFISYLLYASNDVFVTLNKNGMARVVYSTRKRYRNQANLRRNMRLI